MRAAYVSLTLALAAVGSAQSVLLRYHPPVGKVVKYTTTMSMSMTMPMGGPSAKPMQFKQIIPVQLKVVSHSGNATTVQTTSGPAKMVGAANPMMGQPPTSKPTVATMTIDEFGMPKGAAGGGATAAMMGGMASSMGSSGQGVVFPKGPVKVGDTWTSNIDFGKLMGAATKGMKSSGRIPMVFKLVAVKGGIATIDMTAKGTLAMDMGGRTINVAMDMKTSTLTDIATGLSKSSVTSMDSTTTLPGMGSMKQHMSMTMK